MWRLVLDGKMSWADVSQMDIDDLSEANAALDIYISKLNKANK